MFSLLAALAASALAQPEVYVAANGSDRNPGTASRPVASLEAARDRARAIHGHVIVVRAGEYRLTQSFSLDARDDGLLVEAAKGARPRLTGSVDIPGASVKPCRDTAILDRIIDPAARSRVEWVDLAALGIKNLPPMQPRGFPHPPAAAPTELFQDRVPMTLARWPNEGYTQVGRVIEPGNGEKDRDQPKRKPVFTGVEDRAKLWTKAEGLWLYGYWKYDWADESIKVESIDPATGAITLANPHVYGVDKGKPFYAENLIEELDQPGEYWIDRATSRLYFIPSGSTRKDGPAHSLSQRGAVPACSFPTQRLRDSERSTGLGGGEFQHGDTEPHGGHNGRSGESSRARARGENEEFEFSTLAEPLVTVTGASKVTIRSLDLCVSRGDGVQIRDCQATRLDGCRLFALGGRGAVVEGGHDCGLQSCDVWATGEGGVALSGGDRKTLQPARNFVDNCDIHDFERRSQTYRPAVLISGVGNRVSHCAMHDAPHSAIIYGGNNHIIEYNEFYKTISRTGDGGVVYTGRDWTARGTQIRFNYFHDNIGLSQWEPAIYVDDLGSGIVITGNLIVRCHWGFLIGGGRDNVIEDNTLVDCKLAFDCDARGLGWAKSSLPTMMAGLNAVPYQQEPWRSRYPALVDILDHDPLSPSGNILRNNFLVRSGKVLDRMEEPFRKTAKIEGNVETDSAPASRLAPVKGVGIHRP